MSQFAEEQEDGDAKRARECITQLRVIANYVKDFREIADIAKKEARSKAGDKSAAVDDSLFSEEPTVEIVWTYFQFVFFQLISHLQISRMAIVDMSSTLMMA